MNRHADRKSDINLEITRRSLLLAEVRHDKAEEAAKSFRISSGNGRVCTTFAAEFEAFGEDKTELLQEHLLLSRRFGNAAQADLAAIGSRQNDIGAFAKWTAAIKLSWQITAAH